MWTGVFLLVLLADLQGNLHLQFSEILQTVYLKGKKLILYIACLKECILEKLILYIA